MIDTGPGTRSNIVEPSITNVRYGLVERVTVEGMNTHDADSGSGTTINSVTNAVEVVEHLHEAGPSTATEVSEALGRPLSTVHVYLTTLCEAGYVLRRGDEYRIGLRHLELGGAARHELGIYHAAKPEVPKLAAETDEVANLGVEEGGLRVLLDKSEAPEGIYDNPPIGQFTNMHWTSLGKAILSTMTPERVESIVETHGLPRATDNTITDLESLKEELATVRERGHSIEDEERREGIRAVGVPIEGESDDRALGAISVSGPRQRIVEKHTSIVDALESTATVVELRYKHY